ncbi:MAG: hypothetical protein JJE22_17050, partial [Bacteroidia bacterium]|nr:hypothetical protein [Bacteroidia bacterium]
MQNKPALYRIFFKPNRIRVVWMIGITQVFFSFSSFSQDSSAFTIAKDKLVKTLKERFIDKAYTESID